MTTTIPSAPPGSAPPPEQIPDRFTVLATGINAVTPAAAIRVIGNWIARREKHYVNVCNSATVMQCYDRPDLAEIVNRSGLAVPDGMPLVWLGRWRRLPVARVYGPDLLLALCDIGQAAGYRHFLYGSTEPVLSDLQDRLRARFPPIAIAGAYSPPFRDLTPAEEEEVVALINGARPDIVWVGLGTPKQDYWVGRFRPRLDAPVLIAVGAAFPFHAGRVPQAPRWMMRCGLEWLFRLCAEPRRLWRRYLVGNPRFAGLVVRQFLTGKPVVNVQPSSADRRAS